MNGAPALCGFSNRQNEIDPKEHDSPKVIHHFLDTQDSATFGFNRITSFISSYFSVMNYTKMCGVLFRSGIFYHDDEV